MRLMPPDVPQLLIHVVDMRCSAEACLGADLPQWSLSLCIFKTLFAQPSQMCHCLLDRQEMVGSQITAQPFGSMLGSQMSSGASTLFSAAPASQVYLHSKSKDYLRLGG